MRSNLQSAVRQRHLRRAERVQLQLRLGGPHVQHEVSLQRTFELLEEHAGHLLAMPSQHEGASLDFISQCMRVLYKYEYIYI